MRPRYDWSSGRYQVGDIETDAHFLYVYLTDSDVYFAASNVTGVRYKDQILMEVLSNTFGLQLDGSADRVGKAKWRFWEETLPLDTR